MHCDQPLRPQVHYTPITGQIGDATGLIVYKGVYHLFYMYDEWSRRRRFNKSWGHAVSNDLVFGEQQPQILNTRLDNAPESGSGIVDWNNTLGLQSGVEKTLVVFYPVKLRMIVDRGSVEVYAHQGEVTFTKPFYPDPANMNLELFAEGGPAKIRAMEVYRLQSIWLKREQELGYIRYSTEAKR